jgi:hypothetical protein
VEFDESYKGRRIIVRTRQTTAGAWTSEAELLDDGHAVPIAGVHLDTYGSEEEARCAALSAATAAVDRDRASRGKP